MEGLRDRPRSGRPRLLTSEQEAAFKARIEAGPEYERDGVVAFRSVDMRRRDLANRVFDELGQAIKAGCRAWNKLIADTVRLISLINFTWARLNSETS